MEDRISGDQKRRLLPNSAVVCLTLPLPSRAVVGRYLKPSSHAKTASVAVAENGDCRRKSPNSATVVASVDRALEHCLKHVLGTKKPKSPAFQNGSGRNLTGMFLATTR